MLAVTRIAGMVVATLLFANLEMPITGIQGIGGFTEGAVELYALKAAVGRTPR